MATREFLWFCGHNVARLDIVELYAASLSCVFPDIPQSASL